MEQTKNHILTVMDKRMKKFEDKNMAYSTKIEKFELEMDEKMELVRNMLNQSRSKLKKNGANTPSRSPTRKTNNIRTFTMKLSRSYTLSTFSISSSMS